MAFNYEAVKPGNEVPVIFYIASGSRYVAEAERSAKSVRSKMPGTHTILFTPDEIAGKGIFGDVIRIAKSKSDLWFFAHLEYMQRAMQCMAEDHIKRCIFLDADTYIVEPVHDLFDLLNEYDFFGAHAPGRHTCGSASNAPECFPEINVGVNGFYLGQHITELMNRAMTLYKRNRSVYGDNDQGAIRDALWWVQKNYEHFRWYVIPTEYNLRFNQPCFARGKVRVLHGHSDNIESIAEKANRDWKSLRAWEHGISQG